MHDSIHRTFISSIVGIVIANTGVALRLTARWVGGIRITVDDYLMLVALVSLTISLADCD